MHDLMRVARGEQGAELLAQHRGLLEAAVRDEVVAEETVDCAGDVASDRIQHLVFAAEAVGAARIEQQHVRPAQMRGNVIGVDPSGLQRERVAALYRFGRFGVEGLSGAAPCLQAAVEHRHAVMTKPAHEPPQACGEHSAGVVVGDDLAVAVDAALAKAGGELRRIGQRVTAVGAGANAR